MATVAESLFGVTPESLMLERDRQAQAQALRIAQLEPLQQARYTGFMAANQLGNAIGGLLGAQDPELQKARRLQEISKQFDLTTIDGAREAAKALSQAGYQREAMLVADRVNTMRKTEADYLKATRGTPGTASERARSMIAGFEVKLAGGKKLEPEELANARWLVAQETKPKAFRDADTGELITIQPLDLTQAAPNLAKLFAGSQETAGAAPAAPAVTPGVSPTEPGQSVSPAKGVTVTKIGEGKGLDASTVAKIAEIDQNITKLGGSVKSLESVGKDIESLDLGLVQNLFRSGAAFVGKNTPDRIKFDAVKRKALAEANNLLLLARGVQTEGDAQRAKDQIADENTWKNPEALKAAFDDLKRTHQNTLEALRAQRTTLTSRGKNPAPAAAGSNAGGYSQDQEALIARWMSANKQSRDAVIAELKRRGKL